MMGSCDYDSMIVGCIYLCQTASIIGIMILYGIAHWPCCNVSYRAYNNSLVFHSWAKWSKSYAINCDIWPFYSALSKQCLFVWLFFSLFIFHLTMLHVHFLYAGVRWLINKDKYKNIKFCCAQTELGKYYINLTGVRHTDVHRGILFVENQNSYHLHSSGTSFLSF